MPDVQGTYRYTPITESQIRLLLLDPEPLGSPGGSELSGSLSIFELTVGGDLKDNDAPKYDALSYTWGSVSASTAIPVITIYDASQSVSARRMKLGTIIITPNLDQALREFRTEVSKTGRYLWIDAICIQQEGDGHGHEKGAQIRKMPDIFSEAWTVRIWLGLDETNGSTQLFDFIRSILSLDDFNVKCSSTDYAPQWDAFHKLMQRAWFQRRWIVQEVAFASSAMVYYGSQSLSWSDFASAVQLFASKKSTLRAMFQQAAHAKHNPHYLGEIEALAATQLVKTLDLLFRRSKDGNIMEKLLSLETLLANMTAFDVLRPHDAVYAIMQLSHNAVPISLPATQSISPPLITHGAASTRPPPVLQVTMASEIGTRNDTQRPLESPKFLMPAIGSPNTSQEIDFSTSVMQKVFDESSQRGRSGSPVKHRSTPSTSSLLQARERSPAPDPSVVAARRKAERAKSPTRFTVDYNKSVFSLCTDIIDFCIKESRSIDVICRAWVPSLPSCELLSPSGDPQFPLDSVDTVTLPSWMCSVERRPHEAQVDPPSSKPQYHKLRRVNADSLVGSGFKGFKTYSASGQVQLEPSDYQIKDRILSTKGFELATIDLIQDPAQNALIPGKWLKLVNEPKAGALPDEFWRTLVANRESSDTDKPATQYWRQACEWVLAYNDYSLNRNIDTGEHLQNISGYVPEPVVEFLNRVRAVVWNRKLFRTRDRNGEGFGLLGLAPDTAQIGDIICILKGGSVPLLLRPKDRSQDARKGRSLRTSVGSPTPRRRSAHRMTDHQRTNGIPSGNSTPSRQNNSTTRSPQGASVSPRSSNDGHLPGSEEYSVIGECYLHGMMDGEAFAEQEKYEIPQKTFRLGCAVECTCSLCKS